MSEMSQQQQPRFQFIEWLINILWLREYSTKQPDVSFGICSWWRQKLWISSFTIKEASDVFRSVQRHVSRHNEVAYFEALWLSRRKVSERVLQLRQELWDFLAQKRHRMCTNFEGNIFLTLLGLEFSAMVRAALCRWGNLTWAIRM